MAFFVSILLNLLITWTLSAPVLAAQNLDALERQLLDDPQAAFEQSVQIRNEFSRQKHSEAWLRASTAMIVSLSYLGRFEEIEAVLTESLTIARRSQWKDLELMLLIHQARYLENRGHSQEALRELKNLEQRIPANLPPRFVASLYTNLANFSLKYGQESEAALYVHKAFDALKTQPHDHTYYAIMNNIGSAFIRLTKEDLERAISIFFEVTSYSKKEGLRFLGNLAAYNLGLCYGNSLRWTDALSAYQDSLSFAKAMNDVQSVAYGHFGIGMSLKGLGRFDDAIKEMHKALKIFEAQKNDFSAFELRLEILEPYLRLNQFAQVEQLIQHLRKDPLMVDALVPLKMVTEIDAMLMMQTGRFEDAARKYESLVELMKKLEEVRNAELTKKYNAHFELERKTQANEILQQQNRLQSLELDGNRRFNAALTVCVALIAIISLIMMFHFFRVRRKNQKIEELQSYIENNILQRFLPAVMVQEVLEGRSRLEESAKMETVTVLFADLCDFTMATDQLGAQTISHMLNDFFLLMTDIVLEEGGTVDKFIGDAIMVLFGAPDQMPPDEQARRAATCAQRMQEGLKKLNSRWESREDGHAFAMRVGIHQGPAVVGSFGGKRRSDYTVVGNSVNIAARIEAIAEANEIVFSSIIAAHLPPQNCRKLGEFQIRGIQEPMALFAMIRLVEDQQTLHTAS